MDNNIIIYVRIVFICRMEIDEIHIPMSASQCDFASPMDSRYHYGSQSSRFSQHGWKLMELKLVVTVLWVAYTFRMYTDEICIGH